MLESGSERHDFSPAWELGAETEAGPEVGNLAAGAGEPGRGSARGAGIRGVEGRQKIPKADPRELTASGSYRHITDTGELSIKSRIRPISPKILTHVKEEI